MVNRAASLRGWRMEDALVNLRPHHLVNIITHDGEKVEFTLRQHRRCPIWMTTTSFIPCLTTTGYAMAISIRLIY